MTMLLDFSLAFFRNVEVAPRYDPVRVVLGLLRQVVQLLVQRLDGAPVLDAVERAGAQVGHLGVVSVDEVVEYVVDAQLSACTSQRKAGPY